MAYDDLLYCCPPFDMIKDNFLLPTCVFLNYIILNKIHNGCDQLAAFCCHGSHLVSKENHLNGVGPRLSAPCFYWFTKYS